MFLSLHIEYHNESHTFGGNRNCYVSLLAKKGKECTYPLKVSMYMWEKENEEINFTYVFLNIFCIRALEKN